MTEKSLRTPGPIPSQALFESLQDLVYRTVLAYKEFSLETKILFSQRWLQRMPDQYARIAREERPIFHALLKEWEQISPSDFKRVVGNLRHFFQRNILNELDKKDDLIAKKALATQAKALINIVTAESCKTPRSTLKIEKMTGSKPVLFRPVGTPRVLCFDQTPQDPEVKKFLSKSTSHRAS